jgi:hypothetical protein
MTLFLACSATQSLPFGWTKLVLAAWVRERRYGVLDQELQRFGIFGLAGFSGHWMVLRLSSLSTVFQAA